MVEDEKAYADFLSAVLSEHFGRPVCTFTRADEALAALPSLEVGIVVTDYCMPRMDGYQFIQAAAPLLPDVPFIVISGHALHLEEHLLSRLTAVRAILAKPFSWRKLAEAMEAHAPELRRSASGPDPSPVCG